MKERKRHKYRVKIGDHYELMEALSDKKMKERKRHKYRVKIGDEWKTYYSLAKLARDFGLNYNTLYARYQRQGPKKNLTEIILPTAQWVRQ